MKRDFTRRSEETELMDTESIDFDEFHECLRQLEIINIWTLAYHPTLQWLRRMMVGRDPNATVTIFDIGCGGADMLRKIWTQNKKTTFYFKLIGIDSNPWSRRSAELLTPKAAPILVETSNIFSLASGRCADFIICSLFTHHLDTGDLVRFVKWMDSHSTGGWFINDLHRHPLPFYFIKYIVRLFSRNRLIRHDAPVSVARSFTAADWRGLLNEAGIAHGRAKITWFFPFRYGVSCRKA